MSTESIEEEALHLPADRRARLARLLLESLDGLSAADAERLWLLEAERRAGELDEGAVKPVSAQDFERRMAARSK